MSLDKQTNFYTATTRNPILGLALVVLLLMNASCAVTIPLDATMRIDTRGFNEFRQNGHLLKRSDMLDKLEQEPENRDRVESVWRLADTAIALSVIGGAAMGWTGGKLAANASDPNWEVAGFGAGLFLCGALPMAIVSNSQLSDAVAVHNRLVAERPAREKREAQEEELRAITTTRVKNKSLVSLPEGFGFNLDQGPEQTGTFCRALGYEWTKKDSAFQCSGIPLTEIKNASAEISFADEHVAGMRVFIHPQKNLGSWANAVSNVETVLIKMYGSPSERNISVPSDCAGNAFMGCLTGGKVTGQTT